MQKISGLKLAGRTVRQAVKNISLPSRYSQRNARREVLLGRKYPLSYNPSLGIIPKLEKPLAVFAERNEAVMAKRRELLKEIGMPWAQMHHTLDLFRIAKAAAIARGNKGVCEERAAKKLCRYLIKNLNERIKRDKKAGESVVGLQQFVGRAQAELAKYGRSEKEFAKSDANMGDAVKTLLVFHPTGRKNPLYVGVDFSVMTLVKVEAEAEIANILGKEKAVFTEAELAFRRKHNLLKN
ncbi:Uncharacterised protein [uncultured archaeon]|nr:Uncharacterised protein [uncultured archaeon]